MENIMSLLKIKWSTSTTQHLNTGVRLYVCEAKHSTNLALSEHYIHIVKHVDTRCWLRPWVVAMENIMSLLKITSTLSGVLVRAVSLISHYEKMYHSCKYQRVTSISHYEKIYHSCKYQRSILYVCDTAPYSPSSSRRSWYLPVPEPRSKISINTFDQHV